MRWKVFDSNPLLLLSKFGSQNSVRKIDCIFCVDGLDAADRGNDLNIEIMRPSGGVSTHLLPRLNAFGEWELRNRGVKYMTQAVSTWSKKPLRVGISVSILACLGKLRNPGW